MVKTQEKPKLKKSKGKVKGKRMEWVAEDNRERIKKALVKEGLTFGELLKMEIVTDKALSSHLKEMMKERIVQKTYDAKKGKVVYQLTEKGKGEAYFELMMWNLGVVATFYIIGKKYKESKIDVDQQYNIYKKIDFYLHQDFPWKEMFDYSQRKFSKKHEGNNYPLTI